MYLSFADYQSMGGTLDETTFNDYEFEAECLVNWYTFNRLMEEDPENYPEVLPRLMFRLIRMALDKANLLALDGRILADGTISDTPYISNQSNDGVSVSYNTISASDLFTKLDKEMGDTIERYLNGVMNSLGRKLLYRGLYPNE